ncbi:ATP-binding cassette domain-containing protein [Homoserinibacter gongjuensis]|nr:ATP-binding cassette domain-containing protein [Homoserinibacter gongjuensis]
MDALNPVARLDAQFADVLAAKNPGMRRAAIAARTRELLATVGVPVERMRSYPHELSGGTRQRAAIALALACNPRLVVMDEATTAVDVVMQRQIVDQVLRLRDLLGFAVVFVTHDLALLLEIADTVVVMRNGKVVERSDVEDVGGPRSEEYTRELFHAFPTLTPTAMGLERPDDARV